MKPVAVVCAWVMFWANVAVAAGPVVFHVSDPVGPDETALLFGDGLAGVTAKGWVLKDEPIASPPDVPAEVSLRAGTPLAVLQTSDLCAKVLLPADWPPAIYAILLQGTSGGSPAVFLNRTEPWWWLGEAGQVANPGETIRVVGKNLGEKPAAWLLRRGNKIALAAAENDLPGATGYHCKFTLPHDIAPGQYQLWVHNGHGGQWGFGRPLMVNVAASQPWPTRQFDVRSFDAVGDGVADDTSAFAGALAKAGESGGGVVYVPRGRYKITAKLLIPPKTVLRGEKRELVWLVVPKDLPEIDTVLAGNGDFAVEDLSIVAQTARRLVVCPDYKAAYNMPWGNVPPGEVGHNAHLRRLRLHHLRYAHRVQKNDPRRLEDVGPSTVLLAGPDMELRDCEVVSPGMPLVLIESRHGLIWGNRLDTGRNGWYGLWGAEETLLANNEIQGRDLEGSYGGVQGKASRLLIAGNHFHDAYGDEREALTFDTPYHPTWMGHVASQCVATFTTTFTAAEYDGTPKTWKPGALVGQLCLIAYGKGLGQYHRIVANSETDITLAEPWAVAPDATSHLVVRVDKSDVVIAGNHFADASAAVQLYAQSLGFILDGNTSERTGGMYGIGWDAVDQRHRRRYSTCWFNQWLNNRLKEGFIYQQGAFDFGVVGPCASGSNIEPATVVAIGNVVRNNILEDHQTTGAMYFSPHPLPVPASAAGYFGRDTIVEKNRIADTPLAIDVYPRYIDTLLRANTVERAAQPLRDDGQNTWIDPAERLRYQYQSAREILGPAFTPGDLGERMDRLASPSASLPGKAAAAAKLFGALWKEVVRCRPQGVPPQLAAALLGLHYEFATSWPGKTELAVRARTEPWSPPVELDLQVVPPDGWQSSGKKYAPLSAAPAVLVELKAAMPTPDQADVQRLEVRIVATWDGMPLLVCDSIDVSQREIRNWFVLGPLPNRSGTLPDTFRHPAETRLDAAATYDGVAGRIGWKPMALANRYVNFAKFWKPQQAGTALALACLRAERPMVAQLQLHSRGVLELSLNGQPVAKIDPPSGGKTLRVELREGDNLLLAKSSFTSGPWELAVDVKPLAPGVSLIQVPAADLPQLEAIRPRKATPSKHAGLLYPGPVAWHEILSDDFQRQQLGPQWSVVSGKWTIRDGVLHGQDRAFLAAARKVSLPLRIEYDARSAAPSDLSCFWLRDPADSHTGCLFAFAAGESGSRLECEAAKLADSDTALAKSVPNRWHHVIAQVLPDGVAELYVDGQPLLHAKLDPRPVAAAFPGLWTWGEGDFDNVRIFTAGP